MHIKIKKDLKLSEREHFKKQSFLHGSSWWGQCTPAGKHRLERRRKLINCILNKENKEKILELGCGSQPMFSFLEENRFYVACDLTLDLLLLAKKSTRVYYLIQANTQTLPFKSQSFDAVIGNGILHHVNLELTLVEIKRVIKRGGEIIFFEPNMLNPQIFLERKTGFIRKIHQTPGETAFYKWRLKRLLEKDWRSVKVEAIDFLHPSVPQKVIGMVNKFGLILEKTPFIKEFGGSLLIYAKK